MRTPNDYATAPTGMREVRPRPRRGQPAHGPSSGIVVAVIACFLLPISLIPSSKGFFFHLPFLPAVWWKTNLIVLFCILVVCLRPFLGYSRSRSKPTRCWFLWPLLLLSAWQIVSLAWNDRDGLMKSYSLLQSIFMAAAVTSGVLLSSGMSLEGRTRLGRGVAIVLALIFAVYLGLSFVLPSWRPSSQYIDRSDMALGFIRMFGPLGRSTTLLFILLPVLGYSMGMLFIPGRSRPFWIGMSLFFLFATIATGSRGALVCLAAFVLCLVTSLRLRAAWLLLPPMMLLPFVLMATGIPERFTQFEDRVRLETYATAMRAFSDSPSNVLFGTGHGELYSVLHDTTDRKALHKDRWYLLTDTNAFGFTLRSSHTAILRTLTETGIVGFVFLAIPIFWVTKRLFWPRIPVGGDPYGMHANCALAGCVAVVPYMFLDEFFVSAYWIVFLWCLFVVIGAESQRDADFERKTKRQLHAQETATHKHTHTGSVLNDPLNPA